MGGLISSTATTVSYARRNRRGAAAPATATLVVIIASATVFVRVLFEIAVVAPGLLATAVLLGVAAAQDNFGDAGVYAVAALSGLTDMDAITLSTAQLVNSDQLSTTTGWRVILVGSMANLVFKGLVAAIIGGRRLAAHVAVAFGVGLIGSALVLWLWPA